MSSDHEAPPSARPGKSLFEVYSEDPFGLDNNGLEIEAGLAEPSGTRDSGKEVDVGAVVQPIEQASEPAIRPATLAEPPKWSDFAPLIQADDKPESDAEPLAGKYEIIGSPRKEVLSSIAVAISESGTKVRMVEFANDSRGVRMIRRINDIAGISCPYFVKITEVGFTSEVIGYVEDYGDWKTLREVIAGIGVLDEPAIANIGTQLGLALESLRRLGILHRNISPATILVNDELSEIRLRGFELAVKIRSDQHVASVAGIPAYMAPEAAARRAGFGSDVFAVGATLFEAITRRTPFKAETSEDVLRVVATKPALRPSLYKKAVSPELDEIISRALDLDPAMRSLDTRRLRDLAQSFGR